MACRCRSKPCCHVPRHTPQPGRWSVQITEGSHSLKFQRTRHPKPIKPAGKEAAAEALGALVWVSFADPGQRDEMRGQVLPALLHMLGATHHDGCRIAALAALRTMAASPGTSDFRCSTWETCSSPLGWSPPSDIVLLRHRGRQTACSDACH